MNIQENIVHPNAEVIKAWAEGKVIQWYCGSTWVDYIAEDHLYGPWHGDDKAIAWRIKPEPRPDVVKYAQVYGSRYNMQDRDNIKLTFDGETGKLKSAEVI